jgi:inosine-uridine nucleoside N-ribohydrolase
VLLHVDTDFGGDPDDACALAMLLGWPDVEITGITTNLDRGGQRAGCVEHYLELAARRDIPVAAGASASLTNDEQFTSTWGDERYWPDAIVPEPSSPEHALDLLADSARRAATIVAIGAFTNLALLELARPDTLRDAHIVAMAGWLTPPDDGLPDWGPEFDFNVQCDTKAADIVISAARVTFVPLPVAMQAQLRGRDLGRLRASGPIGALLARQSEVYASDSGMEARGRDYQRLADDLVNFHWDPLTAAVAAGWSGAAAEDVTLETRLEGRTLVLREAPDGRRHRVVAGIDAESFTEAWLAGVETADRRAATRRGSAAR